MIHFEQVLPKAREIIDASPTRAAIASVLVLRDLRGRVRIFLAPKESERKSVEKACAELGPQLATELAPFWGGVIDLDVDDREFGAILGPIRGEAEPVRPSDDFDGWKIVERHVAKSAWTSSVHHPPWPLNPRTPAVLAWYSHKGGVGRSTALCATAMHLARAGNRVVVIDLDLESPGLGSLLSASPIDYGVVDYLLEHLLAEPGLLPALEDYSIRQNDADLIGDTGAPIVCLPAGRLDEWYLEKLARLDYEFLATVDANTRNPLAELLLHIKRYFEPSYIFLDCRAGLHDLGGLAVQQLSHANVLFGLDSQQSWDGLRCIIRRLARVSSIPPCLVIQAMHEGAPGPRRVEVEERFRQASYEIFCAEFYEEGDVPDIASKGEAHDPFPLPYDARVAGYQTLSQAAELLLHPPFDELADRIKQLAQKATIDGS